MSANTDPAAATGTQPSPRVRGLYLRDVLRQLPARALDQASITAASSCPYSPQAFRHPRFRSLHPFRLTNSSHCILVTSFRPAAAFRTRSPRSRDSTEAQSVHPPTRPRFALFKRRNRAARVWLKAIQLQRSEMRLQGAGPLA